MFCKMFIDVCIPKNNEAEFIKVAEKLGTKGLLFLYDKYTDVSKLQETTKVRLFSAGLNKGSVVFAKAERKNIENKNIKFLYGLEEIEAKDSFHYRRAGLNQVLAKLVKEKDKILVLDMEKILVSKDPSVMLGRMKQNLMMIKKYKLNSIICSFATKPENLRAKEEYSSLIKALGYEEQAKQSVNILEKNLL